MTTMTLEEYNTMVQDSVIEVTTVMKTSVTGDAPAIAEAQLTPEAKFEQVKNSLYDSLDKAGTYALTKADDIAIASGSKISENYWKTVAASFDKWKLNVSTANSVDAIVDAYAKGAAQTFQGLSKNAPSIIGLTAAFAQAMDTISTSTDSSAISDGLGLMSTAVFYMAAVDGAVALLGLGFFPALGLGIGIGILAVNFVWPDVVKPLLDWINSGIENSISDLVNSNFISGQRFRPGVDPLVFDLDGDGIETLPLDDANSTMFDLNADGSKVSTGWIAPDDAFLAYDRNGNGTIDDGSELFGDATPINNGTEIASDGFQALADFDSNADGVVDANDAEFANLQIWQDVNSDGISQADELLTLEEAGIASINTMNELTGIIPTINNTDSNIITATGSYTRTDGSTSESGTLSTVETIGDLILANNPFYSEFIDPVTISTEAEALPTMQGSGLVRDMREAASIDTEAGRAFAVALADYAALNTREEQLAAIDGLLLAWSETSGMETMIDRALAARYIPEFSFGVNIRSNVDETYLNTTYGDTFVYDAYNMMDLYNDLADPGYLAWINKVNILDRFNGQSLFAFSETENNWGVFKETTPLLSVQEDSNNTESIVTYYQVRFTVTQNTLQSLELSYQALRDSVYEGLITQTRLKPYLDEISVAVDVDGNVSLDFTNVESVFDTTIQSDNVKGVTDLIELIKYKGASLTEAGWYGLSYLGNILPTLTIDAELQSVIDELNVLYSVNAVDGVISGSEESEHIAGDITANTINGNGGDDTIDGNLGNDVINGGTGNDQLYGNAGNDIISGNENDDSLFGGEGDDELYGDKGNDLIVGDDGIDKLIGGDGHDHLMGELGNDELYGDAGNDILEGGEGNDTLDGGDSRDYLYGGAGDDELGSKVTIDAYGTTWDGSQYLGNEYTGGTGNDILNGSSGADTYYFNSGDGVDTIDETVGGVSGRLDRIVLGTGFVPADVNLTRDNTDLLINFSNGTDQIRVNEWYVHAKNRIELLEFADGTIWNVDALHVGGLKVHGSEANDTLTGLADEADMLYGEGGNDTIIGDSGRDQLYGGAGDDVLGSKTGPGYYTRVYDPETGISWGDEYTGGLGNDILNGNCYSDVYYFNNGDGQDTIDEIGGLDSHADQIVLGENITTTDVSLTRDNMDLLINFSNGTDQIRVNEWYVDSNNRIELLGFDDGTVWDVDALHVGGLEVHGSEANDTLTGLADEDDMLYGEGGDDTITGDSGRDQLYGGAGDDVLGSKTDPGYYTRVYDPETGISWGDEYTGGLGDDTLNGNYYSDVYYFNAGDGVDTIDEIGGLITYADQIVLGLGIMTTNVSLTRENTDLLINFANGTDQIQIKEWYASTNNRVESLLFSDGTEWDVNIIHSGGLGLEVQGTVNADTLYGDSGNNRLYGDDGNDALDGGLGIDRYWGGAGNDVLGSKSSDDFTSYYYNPLMNLNMGNEYTGGTGNDLLNGSQGGDTYYFNAGDGMDTIDEIDGISGAIYTDTIKLGTDITEADVSIITRDDSDLLINFTNGTDQIRVSQWYDHDDNRVERLEFADETFWDVATMHQAGLVVHGLSGHGTDPEILFGLDNQNDRIFGEGGNDIIFGNGGNDNLYGGLGDDYLIGASGNDIMDGGEGSNTLYGGEGFDVLYSSQLNAAKDYYYGQAGNDIIIASYGNDYLDGGTGTDTLMGGTGDNTFIFARGYDHDTIFEAGTDDTDQVNVFVDPLSLMFERTGNNLDMRIAGTDDKLTVSNWYSSDNNKINEFSSTSNGTVLLDSQIDQLIQAMAVFSVANGGITWEQAILDRPDEVQTILTEHWQPAA